MLLLPRQFTGSPADLALRARFNGTPITFAGDDGFAIGRFLRALNVAFNLDIAKQRLRAAQTLFNRFRDTRVDLQIKLMQLAVNELDDARDVLTTGKVHAAVLPGRRRPHRPREGGDRGRHRRAGVVARRQDLERHLARRERARPDRRQRHFTLGQGNLFF